MYDNRGKTCKVDGCERKANCREMCVAHYGRWYRNGEPGHAEVKPAKIGGVCEIEGCEKKFIARGYCTTHYQRWNKHGDALAPWVEVRERSDLHIDYIGREWNVNKRSGGYVGCDTLFEGKKVKSLFHRVVMQDVLGRDLLPGENVHHMNGDRSDNRPGNLELWSSSQPSGQRVSDKIEWAIEILRQYGIDPNKYRPMTKTNEGSCADDLRDVYYARFWGAVQVEGRSGRMVD